MSIIKRGPLSKLVGKKNKKTLLWFKITIFFDTKQVHLLTPRISVFTLRIIK